MIFYGLLKEYLMKIPKILLVSLFFNAHAIWFSNHTDQYFIIYNDGAEVVCLKPTSCTEVELDVTHIKRKLDLKILKNGVELIDINESLLLTDVNSDTTIYFGYDHKHNLHFNKQSLTELSLPSNARGQMILKRIEEIYKNCPLTKFISKK